jgi:Rieske 2Fe-2S family protein
MNLPLVAELEATRRDFAAAVTLPRTAYVDDGVFALERRALFSTHWICVGHVAAVAHSGDYIVREVAGESIVVIRDDKDRLHAFYNVCRHRGSRLLDDEGGCGLSRIVCPYHAWSYQLDGRLLAAPQVGTQVPRDSLALTAVRLAILEGLIFVNFDAGASPVDDWFADLPDLQRFNMPQLRIGRRIEYAVRANWKLIIENYSECYHCPGAHPQLHKLTELIGRSERPMESGRYFNGGPMRLRDGIGTMSGSGAARLPLVGELSADDRRYVHYYVLYPNVLLSPHPDYVLIHTLWPKSAGMTQVVCEWLVSAAALAGPPADLGDVVDFWDITNRQDWALCERAQLGVTSRGYRQGPYAAAEDCVHAFDRWYAGFLLDRL